VLVDIQNLPAVQQPEVFGMHDNISISKELQETKQLFDNLLLTQGRGGEGGVASNQSEEQLYTIATDVLKKVNREKEKVYIECRLCIYYTVSSFFMVFFVCCCCCCFMLMSIMLSWVHKLSCELLVVVVVVVVVLVVVVYLMSALSPLQVEEIF